MKHKPPPKHILIVDEQEYWRNLSARALRAAGFSVQTRSDYTLIPANEYVSDEPDLVILGCASIGHREHQFIAQILDAKYHLLVLCTSLPLQAMRSVFLAGADDVGDKPYDPERLVTNVEQALELISTRDRQ